MSFMGPYTKRDGDTTDAWAQREYVECMKRGIKFSAHGDYWFYCHQYRAYACTAPTGGSELVVEKLAYDPRTLDWIGEGRRVLERGAA